jgi:hypothetical protein
VRAILVTALFIVLPCSASAQETVAFEGLPLTKVELSFLDTRVDTLDAEQSFQYQVRIVARNGKYYWASRGMKELIRSESGVYITYHAVDGSGYVRTGTPGLLNLRDRLPEARRQQEIGYVEHLLIQFASVTYYGNRK